MSGSSLDDPVMKMYEAQAIVIEKDQEIERMRQEIERLQNSNRNQQKTTKAEEKPAAPKNKQIKLLALKLNVNQLKGQKNLRNQLFGHGLSEIDYFKEFSAQSENLITEKQSEVQPNTSVIIMGDMENLNTIYLLDSMAQCWKKLKITLPMGMESFGAVVLNEEIYIFGGVANRDFKQDCYKLNDNGSWMELASLNQKRAYISSSSLVYKEDIWAIGGSAKEFLKSVEKYDILQDKWTYMPEMNFPRSFTAAAVFKDRIFVTGGWNFEKLKSVEMFDPLLQKWLLFCDLPIEVTGHTMLISNSILSIFGGSSEVGLLNSVWELDIEDSDKNWTEKQSFKQPRMYFGIGKLSNGIIVFGDAGYQKSGETSEIFDGNEWMDGPKLPQKLSNFAYISIHRSLENRLIENFL